MIYTLGCKVNTYESNVMKEQLEKKGYREVTTMKEADIIVINTCTVTNTADRKSVKMIHHALKENKEALLIVTGCSSQNKVDEYSKIEGIDILLGTVNKSKIGDYIDQYRKKNEKKIDVKKLQNLPFETMKLQNFNHTRAFIKIQDGCNNFCSYCIIPYVRGNIRSKSLEDIKSEAKSLIQNGHKEIVLTGIHTGNYGKEQGIRLATLLKELVTLKDLIRLRISSIEITEIDDEFLDVLKQSPILVDHMHIPLQSGSDEILKKMNRKYDSEYFLNQLQKIRQVRPDISITTDVIVGFPGESDQDFTNTINTIQKAQFSKLHVFPYSKRKGTKAASMDHQIDEITKKKRVQKLLQISESLEKKYEEKFIGKSLEVIFEHEKEGYLIGHTGNYLVVRMKGDKKDIGSLMTVKAVSLHYPYMEGEKEK